MPKWITWAVPPLVWALVMAFTHVPDSDELRKLVQQRKEQAR